MPKPTREYRIWSQEEEDALKAGVQKHGVGAWEIIRNDPEFHLLIVRTGVQLKDKWRNLVKFRHLSREESENLFLHHKAYSRKRPSNQESDGADDSEHRERQDAEDQIEREEPAPDDASDVLRGYQTRRDAAEQAVQAARERLHAGEADLREALEELNRSKTAPVHDIATAQQVVKVAAERLQQQEGVLEALMRDQQLAEQALQRGEPVPSETWPPVHREELTAGDPRRAMEPGHQQRSKRRKRVPGVSEDRRFGIYDERRYASAVTGGAGGGARKPESDEYDSAGSAGAAAHEACAASGRQSEEADRQNGNRHGNHAAASSWLPSAEHGAFPGGWRLDGRTAGSKPAVALREQDSGSDDDRDDGGGGGGGGGAQQGVPRRRRSRGRRGPRRVWASIRTFLDGVLTRYEESWQLGRGMSPFQPPVLDTAAAVVEAGPVAGMEPVSDVVTPSQRQFSVDSWDMVGIEALECLKGTGQGRSSPGDSSRGYKGVLQPPRSYSSEVQDHDDGKPSAAGAAGAAAGAPTLLEVPPGARLAAGAPRPMPAMAAAPPPGVAGAGRPHFMQRHVMQLVPIASDLKAYPQLVPMYVQHPAAARVSGRGVPHQLQALPLGQGGVCVSTNSRIPAVAAPAGPVTWVPAAAPQLDASRAAASVSARPPAVLAGAGAPGAPPGPPLIIPVLPGHPEGMPAGGRIAWQPVPQAGYQAAPNLVSLGFPMANHQELGAALDAGAGAGLSQVQLACSLPAARVAPLQVASGPAAGYVRMDLSGSGGSGEDDGHEMPGARLPAAYLGLKEDMLASGSPTLQAAGGGRKPSGVGALADELLEHGAADRGGLPLINDVIHLHDEDLEG